MTILNEAEIEKIYTDTISPCWIRCAGTNDVRGLYDTIVAMREALLDAQHELTIVHGLTATDNWGAYNDALGCGADHDGAYECLRDATWKIDTHDVLEKIDQALGKEGQRE